SRNSFEYFDGRGMKQVSLPVKPVSIKPGTIQAGSFSAEPHPDRVSAPATANAVSVRRRMRALIWLLR
ncbi:hypothetical protein JOC45_004309, partial [Gordonia hydrophobica]|nr:hypothetical protein [Gordonia hydrophobica]